VAGLVCLAAVTLPAAQDDPNAGVTAEAAASAPAADVAALGTAPAFQAGRLDPQVEPILRAWSDRLRAAQRFEVEARISARVHAAGETELQSDYRLACERPNKLALVPRGKTFDPTIICDGRALYASAPLLNQYTQDPAPAALDELDKGNAMAVLLTGGSALSHLMLLAAEDPFRRLTLVARQTQDLGMEDIAGIQCRHVRIVQPHLALDLWIEAGDEPRLRRLVPILSTWTPAASAPARTALEPAAAAGLEINITFDNWSLGQPLPADIFRFTPPAQAQRVQHLLTNRRTQEMNPLVGRPAPTFRTTLTDGMRWDLAAHRGKAVVVLDFWASWSAESADRLPVHDQLARAYAGRPVMFLAINTEDTERFANAFLQTNQISLPVAVDEDGAITRLYQVRKLPVTVLIGPDGTIRAVHGPLSADTDPNLGGQIDGLLRAGGLGQEASSQPRSHEQAR
jgi:peroxiredoxin